MTPRPSLARQLADELEEKVGRKQAILSLKMLVGESEEDTDLAREVKRLEALP